MQSSAANAHHPVAIRISFRRSTLAIALLASFAAMAALTGVFGAGKDTGEYFDYFDVLRSGGFEAGLEHRFELGFALSVLALALTGLPNSALMASLVFVSTLIKLKAIWGRDPLLNWMVPLLYLIRFFPLHELTQIRAALAIGFALVAIDAIMGGRRMTAWLCLAAGASFHYSVLAFVPIVLVGRRLTGLRTGVIVATAYACAAALGGFLLTHETVSLPASLALYLESPDPTFAINVLSVPRILDFLSLAWLLSRFAALDALARAHTIAFLTAQALFYATISFPVVALRSSELFSVSWCLAFKGAMQGARGGAYEKFGMLLWLCNLAAYGYVNFWKYSLVS